MINKNQDKTDTSMESGGFTSSTQDKFDRDEAELPGLAPQALDPIPTQCFWGHMYHTRGMGRR
jgi:hypothetical protein